jgi:hypothetical protein
MVPATRHPEEWHRQELIEELADRFAAMGE